jgi:N-methylhydantoinase B
MDDDGIDIGKPVPIRVRVAVAGDEMTVDLSEVSKQVRGFYNSASPPDTPARRWPTSA